jgi:hypothetical protein
MTSHRAIRPDPHRAGARPAQRPTICRLALAWLAWLASLTLLASCSLGNIHQDDCATSDECITLFGLGSQCNSGFCSTPPPCQSDDDCLTQFGRGTCSQGVCAGSCEGKRPNGSLCFACAPTTTDEYLNACTTAACEPFDSKRLTNLPSDGKLPPLP